jgi:GPH family glycoside/pentoside/hexuronide:cation symporter
MTTATDHLSRRAKILYGIGDAGFSLTSTLIAVYFLLFLTDVVGLRPALAGLVMMIARQWDWINDPLIGHISDRVRSRWGRRRPFLLFGALPFVLAFAMMWWRPPVEGQVALLVYYSAAYLLYETAATSVYMPYFALTPELSSDYDERTSLTAYRMVFSILGGLVAFTVPWVIIDTFRPENAHRVWLNGILFGVISGIGLLITFGGTRERHGLAARSAPSLRQSLRAALRNRPFLFSMGIFLLTWLAVDIVQAVLLYFLSHWLHMEAQSDIIFGTIFVTALLVLPIWDWAARYTNKRVAYVVGIAFWAVVQIALVLLRPGPPIAAVIGLSALAGIGVAAAHVLPWAMIPDSVEWDEMYTGARHEGVFYSLVMLAQKAAMGLALLFIGLALEWTGYVPHAARQAPSALNAIRAMTGPVPALLLCGGIAFALFYPIGRATHREIREELARRRTAV